MFKFRKTALSVCLLLSFLLSGCWDIKDIQEVNYLTAIGFDLEEGEFVVYGQLLNFASVAKAEAGKAESIPVWVGKGRGKTLIHAIDDLYRTSQLRIFYGHVNSLVLGEKLLKDESALDQVDQFQDRYYELRHTPWLYGTSEPIDELFSATSIFGLSPGVSVMHQPMETYKQRSVIHPLEIRRFALEMNEPSHTAMLPSIALSDDNWNEGNKPKKMLTINGAYAMKDDRVLGWFAAEDVLGLTWVKPTSYRGPLVLSSGEDIEAAVALEHPNVTIHPRVKDGRATYSIEVKMTGTLVLSMIPMAEVELEQLAEEQVEKQIREVYDKGLKHGADLLNMETALYRKKNREWKVLRSRGKLGLTPESLAEINVSVKIQRTGNMKSQPRED